MAFARRAVIALLTLWGAAAPAPAQRLVILVRHAEKETGTGDVALSAAGKKRADGLVKVLKDSGLDAVVTTEYLRTKQTAEPVARALGITPRVIAARESPAEWAKRLERDHREAGVLIVGHTTTLPPLIDAITGRRNDIVMPDDDYDALFILIRKADGGWAFVRARN